MSKYRLYLDDSYDRDSWMILAGYISTPEVWVAFEAEWRELLPWASLRADGKRHFKMSEMASSADRLAKVRHFARIIDRHPITGISCRVHFASMQKALDRLFVEGRTISVKRRNTAYELCYYSYINNLSKPRNSKEFTVLRDTLKFGAYDEVEFILDDESDKKRLLSSFKKGRSRSKQLPPIFASDREILPLQAADCLAWHVRESAKAPTFEGGDLIEMDWTHLGFRADDPHKLLIDIRLSEQHIANMMAFIWRSRILPHETITVIDAPGRYTGQWGFRFEDEGDGL